jgi:hypothetical protein
VVCCTNFLKIRSFPLPAEYVALGFTSSPKPYKSFGKFTLKSGPCFPEKAQTPLDAVRCLVDDEVISCFILHAKKNAAENDIEANTEASYFWKFFAATIAHGIVDYAQEKDAYVGKNSNICGLFGNEFLKSLHTQEEWASAKQIWSMPRDELTSLFNDRIRVLWVPCQYVKNVIIALQKPNLS